MKLTKKEQKLYDKLLIKRCVDSSTLTDMEKRQLRRLNKKRNKPTKEQAALLATLARASYLHAEAMRYWTSCMDAVNKAYNS